MIERLSNSFMIRGAEGLGPGGTPGHCIWRGPRPKADGHFCLKWPSQEGHRFETGTAQGRLGSRVLMEEFRSLMKERA